MLHKTKTVEWINNNSNHNIILPPVWKSALPGPPCRHSTSPYEFLNLKKTKNTKNSIHMDNFWRGLINLSHPVVCVCMTQHSANVQSNQRHGSATGQDNQLQCIMWTVCHAWLATARRYSSLYWSWVKVIFLQSCSRVGSALFSVCLHTGLFLGVYFHDYCIGVYLSEQQMTVSDTTGV